MTEVVGFLNKDWEKVQAIMNRQPPREMGPGGEGPPCNGPACGPNPPATNSTAAAGPPPPGSACYADGTC